MNEQTIKEIAANAIAYAERHKKAVTLQEVVEQALRSTVQKEREACARIADVYPTWVHPDSYEAQVQMRRDIAAAIRARKD